MVQREMVLRRDGRSLVRFGRIAGVLVVMMVSTLWYASQRPGPVGAQVVPSARAKGSVNLFYAGSLVGLVTQDLGPAFHKATGYTINGLPGGSGELANEIKTGAQKADVFLSAAPSADLALEGTKNGNWLHWYLPLGESHPGEDRINVEDILPPGDLDPTHLDALHGCEKDTSNLFIDWSVAERQGGEESSRSSSKRDMLSEEARVEQMRTKIALFEHCDFVEE